MDAVIEILLNTLSEEVRWKSYDFDGIFVLRDIKDMVSSFWDGAATRKSSIMTAMKRCCLWYTL